MTRPAADIPYVGAADIHAVMNAGSRFVITTHVNPDGDALGSEYALAHCLLAMGKTVDVLNTSETPDNLLFMDPGRILRQYHRERDLATLLSADAVFVVDVNAAARLRTMEEDVRACGGRTWIIDHHLDPEPFAAGYWTDTSAASTAEMVATLVDLAGTGFTRDVATGLYIGVMTDTGSFRFERTTPVVHRLAARLLEAGVDPTRVYQEVYDSFPLRRTKLIGLALAGIRPLCDGRATVMTITHAMYAESGASPRDVEDIVNLGLAIHGVQATALLAENDDGIRCSFRSRGAVHIVGVAREFGGGGHAYAAGATVRDMPIDRLADEVAARLCALVRGT